MTAQDTPVVADLEDQPTDQLEPTPASTNRPNIGLELVGGQTVPADGTLIRIRNPKGADQPIFGIQYRIFGVDIFFEIGDRARVVDLFGGVDAFDDFRTVTQRQFDQADIISTGSVDEILGSTESLTSQIERQIRAIRQEGGIPDWLRRDREAMTKLVLAEQDGWSQQRLFDELSGTRAFRSRFGNLEAIASRTGSDDPLTNVTEFLRTEDAVRREIRRFRGPQADTSDEYLRNLVVRGWQATEVTELLELERELVENPDALANINELLAAQNYNVTLGPDEFIEFMREGRRADRRGFTPSELFRTINDALRLSSLEAAGVTGISRRQALGFGQGDPGAQILDPTFFRDQAQELAGILAANFNELDTEKLGLSRDEVLNFFLEGPGGDPRAGQLIERFARDRGIAARGFDRPQSFIDAEGRLRVQGFADLTD